MSFSSGFLASRCRSFMFQLISIMTVGISQRKRDSIGTSMGKRIHRIEWRWMRIQFARGWHRNCHSLYSAPVAPPAGFRFAAHAASIATDAQLNLVIRHIMHEWDTQSIESWFKGLTQLMVSRQFRTANCVITYERRTTVNRHLHVREASILTPEKYRMDQWWLLLDPIEPDDAYGRYFHPCTNNLSRILELNGCEVWRVGS